MKITTRPDDMSPHGKLNLIKQDDGDIIIEVVVEEPYGLFRSHSVEFCNSGGQSPWTLQALYNLLEAMEKDNRDEPWPPRDDEPATTCPYFDGKECDTKKMCSANYCWAAHNI